MIDAARLGRFAGHPELGAADYKLVHHAGNGRAVYSFCMCPGGTVVAATSEPQRVVTNGMSQYSRNERNANAGIVVAHQSRAGFSGRTARGRRPAGGAGIDGLCTGRQRLLRARRSWSAISCAAWRPRSSAQSFPPTRPAYGWAICRRRCRPTPSTPCARHCPHSARQIRGFDRDDAVLTGVESRTSSPVRITRDAESLQSLNVRGLYPCGEGAGYAGGILSAGVDGIKVAEAVARSLS